jgi:hypothetical protein
MLSASNGWAVGFSNGNKAQTVTEHWNGRTWKVVPSPDPGGSSAYNALSGVTAVSSSNVWAVGTYVKGSALLTLIEHWNGTAWQAVPSPNPVGTSGDNELRAVTAISARNVWAVGNTGSADGPPQTLIEHWDGKAWTVVPSPNPSFWDGLYGVTATSARNVWAVGLDFVSGLDERTVIERWNGTAWRQVRSPNPGPPGSTTDFLDGVAATAAGNVWAVGSSSDGALIEHWGGAAWKVVKSPSLKGIFSGVAAVSSRSAWAVGFYTNGTVQTLIEHWNGTAWRKVTSPDPGGPANSNQLNAVTATSSRNAWAVGGYSSGTAKRNLILHCG